MNTPDKKAMQLLERKIETIVRNILREKSNDDKESKEDSDSGAGYGDVESDEAYKRKYKAVENYLNSPEVDATQVMAKALGFDPKDDSARSHAFKKLHKDPTPDGNGVYQFDSEEISKIFSVMS